LRSLELLLIAVLVVAGVSLFVVASRRPRWRHLLPVLVAGVALVQIAVEGYRWQMLPAYVTVALIYLFTGSQRMFVFWTAVFCLPITIAAPVLFPHFELPEPTGPYAVGTSEIYLVDKDRPETFTSDPGDHREISVRVWYPAETPVTGDPIRYGEHAKEIGRILTRGTWIPPFIFDSQVLITANAYREAGLPAGERRFPVVIFSHAYWAGVSQSTVLMEELASHGYVVLSVAHAYETPFFITRDGGIRAFDPRNAEFRLRGEERARALDLQRRMVNTHDEEKIEALFREIATTRPKMVESLKIWTADISFVMDRLEAMNRGDGFFGGRLTDSIGVMGHSFGGATAHEVCLGDPRCTAGINLDGVRFSGDLDVTLTRPFMFLHHDNPTADNKTPNRLYFERSEYPAYLLLVRGTRHLNFSDLSLYGRGSLVRLLGIVGPIDGRRCLRIQNDYIRAFFDKHLQGKHTSLLDGPSPTYPEVMIDVRNPH
jgi:predicted dienelactone hydrolase